MTQDVIAMAREVWGERAVLPFNELERFAALVAAHEREKQAEQEPVGWNDLDDHELAEKLGWRIGDPLYMTAVGLGQEAIHHFKAKNTAPVRTKDLTDDEIMKINVDTAGIVPTCDRQFHFARAVIAADREKNK